MANIFDVAEYILERAGAMSHMKLQKLAYYAQAWSLVWDEKPLFNSRIEAWANGPVVPQLYEQLRGKFMVAPGCVALHGKSQNLAPAECETVNLVIDYYGKLDPQWLSDLTHMEAPWQDARRGLPPGTRGNQEITYASMAEYYGSL